MGVCLETTLLFAPGASEATRHDVSLAAFCLISGAIGAFKGHSDATANIIKSTVTTDSDTK